MPHFSYTVSKDKHMCVGRRSQEGTNQSYSKSQTAKCVNSKALLHFDVQDNLQNRGEQLTKRQNFYCFSLRRAWFRLDEVTC